jgi:hypothetical protein
LLLHGLNSLIILGVWSYGLFGCNEIGVLLMEPSLTWHELLLYPVRKETCGRWRGLRESLSLLPLHQGISFLGLSQVCLVRISLGWSVCGC